MKKTAQIMIGIACGVILIFSCKTTKTASTTPVVAATYKTSVKKILDQSCNGCHNNPEKKKGDFTTYAGVKAKIDNGTFKELVFEKKTMPPNSALSADDFAKLKQWFDAGSPE